MQFDELIPNIMLVLRKNVLIFENQRLRGRNQVFGVYLTKPVTRPVFTNARRRYGQWQITHRRIIGRSFSFIRWELFRDAQNTVWQFFCPTFSPVIVFFLPYFLLNLSNFSTQWSLWTNNSFEIVIHFKIFWQVDAEMSFVQLTVYQQSFLAIAFFTLQVDLWKSGFRIIYTNYRAIHCNV